MCEGTDVDLSPDSPSHERPAVIPLPPLRARSAGTQAGKDVATLCLPVPTGRIHHVARRWRKLAREHRVEVMVRGCLLLAASTVRYRIDRCTDVPIDPHALWLRTRDETGLEPPALPAFDVGAGGTLELVVDRRVYALMATGRAADLGPLGDELARAVGMTGAEWAPVVGGGGRGTRRRLRHVDDEGSREVSYEARERAD